MVDGALWGAAGADDGIAAASDAIVRTGDAWGCGAGAGVGVVGMGDMGDIPSSRGVPEARVRVAADVDDDRTSDRPDAAADAAYPYPERRVVALLNGGGAVPPLAPPLDGDSGDVDGTSCRASADGGAAADGGGVGFSLRRATMMERALEGRPADGTHCAVAAGGDAGGATARGDGAVAGTRNVPAGTNDGVVATEPERDNDGVVGSSPVTAYRTGEPPPPPGPYNDGISAVAVVARHGLTTAGDAAG